MAQTNLEQGLIAPSPTGSESFRPDIEGMRAVAVLLIMLYHSGIPVIPGGYVGVDVFFVISGFLITGLLVRELEASGTIDRARFYARRIRRLLPAAALVLAAVAILTFVALPKLRWMSVASDIQWSALYAVNWRFAGQAVDYLASEEAASPLQHFWSLAVEEQFYLVWPLLLLGLVRFARRDHLRRSLLIGLVALAIPSLIWSIYETGVAPGRAFFISTTRIWELSVGGALAILAPAVMRLPARLATPLAAIGGLGVLVAALTFDTATSFPGWAAALPVLATAAIIAAGTVAPENHVARALGLRPAQHVGALSYSLYLWHWPFVVIALARWGPLAAWQGAAVVAASSIPAVVSYRLVERRIRYSNAFITPPRRGLLYGAALTAIGLVIAATLTAAVPDRSTPAITAPPPTITAPEPLPTTTTTAAATTTSSSTTTSVTTTAAPTTTTIAVIGPIQPETALQLTAASLTPDPLDAGADLPAVYGDDCHQDQLDPQVVSCIYGDPDPDFQVAIVGDSHAAMWVPTLRGIAEQQGWEIRTITKSNCQLADVVIANGPQQVPYTNCVEWNETVINELIISRPDLVVVAGRFWPVLVTDTGLLDGEDRNAALAAGLASSWSKLTSEGLRLVAVQDVPYPEINVAECVVDHLSDLAECAVDRNAVMDGNTSHRAAAAELGVGLIDLTNQICFADICPAVIDNVLVWRDTHHLTATYARLLADAFAAQLQEFAPELFQPRTVTE